MQAAEVLTVLAEISIALAGFAGVVVALRQRGIDEFQPHELVRFGFMLGIACALLLFALLPFLVHYTATLRTRPGRDRAACCRRAFTWRASVGFSSSRSASSCGSCAHPFPFGRARAALAGSRSFVA